MVGYLVVWGDLSDADLDGVDDLLRTTTGGFLVRYTTPWWEFGGIMRPGYDQSWYEGGGDDNEWWHREVGVENDLFNGHYRENPSDYTLLFLLMQPAPSTDCQKCYYYPHNPSASHLLHLLYL